MGISDWSSDVCSSDLVRWRIAHCLDLVQRRLLRPEMDIEQRTKEAAEARMGMAHVFATVTGVNQHQYLVGFDQLCRAGNTAEQALAEAIEKRTAKCALRAAFQLPDTQNSDAQQACASPRRTGVGSGRRVE